jgi:chemotaxis protein MotB
MNDTDKKPRRRVKKIVKAAAHHGGSWKVAYADFVTAMMALFLVLWLVSQADTKLKQAIAAYFRSPGVFDTLKGGVIDGPKKVSKEPSLLTSKDEEQALMSAAAMLKTKFTTRPEFSKYKDQIKIDVTEQGLRIQILDKADHVSFPSGSADVSPEARPILLEISNAICQLPNPILVGGHTDKRLFPEGSLYTNWELSADRANAARRILESGCVRPEQIRRIVGYADTELLVPEDPYAPANRRISITVMRINGSAVAATTPAGAEGKPAANTAAPTPASEDGATINLSTGHSLSSEKLVSEGAVSAEKPDSIPAGVRKTREIKPPTSLKQE